MADWTDFLKAPTKAAKQLHVSKGDIVKGEALNAYDRLAERMKTGEPYGQTLKDPVEEIENPYPRIRAQLRDKMISDARRKYGEAAPKVTGSLSSSLDVLRHAFMRDEEAKDIARGFAMTAGLAGGVAAPMMVPSAPALTGAVINAVTGVPINLALNSPEGIPQDAVAGGVMGALAGAGHPGLGALAGLASYAATNVPEASAMPLHSWMKYLKNNRGDIGHTPLYVDPTRAELTDARKRSMGSSIESNSVPVVRMMRDLTTPNTTYAWDGNSLLHRDVADHLKLLQTQTRGAISLPEEDPMSWIDWLKQLPQEKAGGGAVKRLGKAAMSQFDELRGSSVAPLGALSVVKNKGGNWLANSVEDALRGLKRSEAVSALNNGPEVLNSWIDNQLTKYVKTRMATEGDEVRKLAEQGVLHVDPAALTFGGRQVPPSGEHLEKLGKSEAAKRWENTTDRIPSLASYLDHVPVIGTQSPADVRGELRRLGGQFAVDNPLEKAYAFDRGTSTRDLGFNHLIDELSNALNPNSGLPRNLQLTPEAVKNMSMEKAVRLVADINAHRAAQKVEANRAVAEQAALVREYAPTEQLPNPKGLRWVELKAPENLTPEQQKYYDKLISVQTDPQVAMGAARKYGTNPLADQLKYEGDTMGHCVGGYCDDVLSGRSRIFSLRDAKGEPHVTVEVGLQPRNIGQQDIPNNYIDEAMEKLGIDSPEGQWGREEEIDRLAGDLWRKDNPGTHRIVQIKGKQNRAPNPEYLPFVQDFVRNSPLGGQWGDVGDLHNTGLSKIHGSSYIPYTQKALPEGFYTDAELKAAAKEAGLDDDQVTNWLFNMEKNRRPYAHGGSVHQSVQNNDFQAMIAALEQELAHATS